VKERPFMLSATATTGRRDPTRPGLDNQPLRFYPGLEVKLG
jgi:hypothetical protein